MPGIYTRRFIGDKVEVSAAIDITVPLGRLWIVSNITGYCEAGGTAYLNVYAPYPVIAVHWQDAAGGVQPSFAWEGRLVLNGDDHLVVSALLLGWDCTVSGYDLPSG